MKAAGVLLASVFVLEAFVLVKAGLVAVGLQETESTMLSIAAIIGAGLVILRAACNLWLSGRRLYKKADAALDNVHDVPALREELASLRREHTEVRTLLQKIFDHLRIDEPGTDRRATDQ